MEQPEQFISELEYDLPDIAIIDDPDWKDYQFKTWIPDQIYLILGQSNKSSKSLLTEQVLRDNVAVYKRPSGGESVILTPKTLVLSTIIHSEKLENPTIYFHTANTKIIIALESLGVKDLNQKGISDIAIGNKKILGSSIYRKTNIVFYHAVLNVSEDTGLMDKYLVHPKKEPDYRGGRKHSEFVSSIFDEGYKIDTTELTKSISGFY